MQWARWSCATFAFVQLYNKYEDLSNGDKLQIMLLIDLVDREIDWGQAHSGLMSSME